MDGGDLRVGRKNIKRMGNDGLAANPAVLLWDLAACACAATCRYDQRNRLFASHRGAA